MKKKLIPGIIISCMALFLVSGIALAARVNVASKLGVSDGDFFEFNGPGSFDSIKIGQQGVGGVTFFNGTIVNSTTKDGNDNPVAFGDNVRIDGRIWRGETAGPFAGAEDMPVIINDDLEVTGDLSARNVYSKSEIDQKLEPKVNSSAVYGKAESDKRYKKKGVSYYSIHPSQFQTTYETAPIEITMQYLRNPSGLFETYFVPVNLPHGADIKSFNAKYTDNDPLKGIDIFFLRQPSDGIGSDDDLAYVSTGEGVVGTTSQTTTNITNSKIDNQNYTYFVMAQFAEQLDSYNLKLHGIFISYEE